jgi:hypothetical protein
MIFEYSISKNHYNKYTAKKTDKVSILLQDLATNCVSPVTVYADKEQQDVTTGREWISKNHRSNPTINERGNLGMIDFEGKPDKLNELLKCIESKDLFYVAVPSQSHKSDKRNSRYHIMYLLSEPYTINAESYKKQSKSFFDYVGYKWDESDSGIDTRATFNACGYFAPTIQLKTDKGKGAKKISDPYNILEDVAKDTIMGKGKKPYEPDTPDDISANEAFTSVTQKGRRKRKAEFKIVRTLPKGYVLSKDSYVETSKGRFMTFEQLTDALSHVDGDNPRISMLGCPICNEGHTAASTIGYSYMQYDSNGKPYIYCTGNACSGKPYFTMAEGSITVYRTDDAAGVSKYVMFEDGNIIYTHDRDLNYKLSPEAVADELLHRGQGEFDEDQNFSRAITINKYIVGAPSIQINHNPFADEGLNIYDNTFTISPAPRFIPIPEEPDDVISEAIKSFEDDAKIFDIPVSLIYIAYYIFHTKQIMAVLALVNPYRGSGKSFWVLDLPTWYLGHGKVAGMGTAAILAGWDDEKLGKRVIVYEDIEKLDKKALGKLRSDIKSDATNGDAKMLNIKGKGKTRSFGFNSALTTNFYDQIPFDGQGDRRIYPSPYKMVSNAGWLSSKLSPQADESTKHRTNAINYLYKIYKYCQKNMNQELNDALYYKVPNSTIRDIVEDSTSTDGFTTMNIIKRAKTKREIIKKLSNVVVSDIDSDDLKELVSEIDLTDEYIRISGATLKSLWKMLPTGRDSMKSLNYRSLLNIFGIESAIKNYRINGKSVKGVEILR